jgi:anaerobic magnesium-protoporphyrin IX monomethyl ester cyclase
VHTKRVIEICQKMIDLKLDIEWTCLSRVDTLREEMIPLMKKAGCKRIYFGAESGSPTVLTYLNKEINLKDAISSMRLCKASGIETLGFFIIGSPAEDEIEFQKSVNFAIEADFDFITVSELIPYPGTELFENVKEKINFSLLPYKNEWKDPTIKERNKQREKEFYKRFYYRRKYLTQSAIRAIKHPLEYFENFKKLSFYLVSQKQKKRADLF